MNTPSAEATPTSKPTRYRWFVAALFFVIYTICGVCAMTASMLFSSSPSVGASGALFGLMGFGIIFGRFRGGSSGRFVAEQLTRW